MPSGHPVLNNCLMLEDVIEKVMRAERWKEKILGFQTEVVASLFTFDRDTHEEPERQK